HISLTSKEAFRGRATEVPVCVETSFGTVQNLRASQAGQHTHRLHWDALPGVHGYRVEIAGDRLFSSIVTSRTVPDNTITLSDLPRGTLYARVAAVNEHNNPSPFCDPIAFSAFDTVGLAIFVSLFAILLTL
ncbi:MAG: fibronectin type III domain-containing protein, partial [Parahaliea sp.]